MMGIYEYYLLIVLCLELSISAFTDIKIGKIKNVVLLFFSVAALPIQIGAAFTGKIIGIHFVLNFFMTMVFVLVFYIVGIWAAGDCKLLISIALIFPYTCYWKLSIDTFKSLSLLLMCLTTIYLYVVSDTIINAVTNLKTLFLTLKKIVTKDLCLSFIKKWFIIVTVSNIVLMINRVVFKWSYAYVAMAVFFVFMLLSDTIEKLKKIWIIALICDVIFWMVCRVEMRVIVLNVGTATLLFGLSRVVQVFNYKIIDLEKLKPGMIISAISVKELQKKVGTNILEEKTDENIVSRLNETDVEYIQSVEIDKIRIVRKIPFALFVLISCLLYLGMEMYYAGCIKWI